MAKTHLSAGVPVVETLDIWLPESHILTQVNTAFFRLIAAYLFVIIRLDEAAKFRQYYDVARTL